ncbi:unnamed protein product [Durusdinium trenchii]|uniref:Sulfotransferase n=1 Tax=Durusdinium trenchii TaxID=1381693 RepID=A0ABP0Q7W3_9DINO
MRTALLLVEGSAESLASCPSSLSPRDVWKTCCNPWRYDGFGSDQCFTAVQGWQARRCCSALEPENFTSRAWRSLFRTGLGPWNAAGAAEVFGSSLNSTGSILVVYHKSGATLSYALQRLPELLRLLLGPETLRWGARWQRLFYTPSSPAYQRSLLVNQNAHGRSMIYAVAPSETAAPEVTKHVLKGHNHRLVHMVRKPSDWIISAYLFHLNEWEAWFDLHDPPNCNNCHHGAWRRIFSNCDFKCSYQELLQNSTLEQGVELEIHRSSWEIIKMLYNMKLWHRAPNTLHLSLVHFSNHFDATVQCMLIFYLEGRALRVPPGSAKMQQLLVAARAAGSTSKKYHMDPEIVQGARQHLQMLMAKEDYRFLRDADLLYDQLMLESQPQRAPTEPRLPNFMAGRPSRPANGVRAAGALFRRKQAKKSQLQAASAVQAAQAVVDGLSCYTVEQLMMAYDHWGLPWTGVVSEWEWQLLARRLLGYDQDHLDDTALHGMWTCIDQQLTGHVAAGDLLQMMRVGQRRVKEPRTHTWQDLSIDVPHPDEHSSAMSAKQEKLWSEATYWRSAWWTSHLRQAQGLLPKVGA